MFARETPRRLVRGALRPYGGDGPLVVAWSQHGPIGLPVIAGALMLTLVASLLVLPGSAVSATVGPDVRISELANGGLGGSADNFIEIANFGDESADLDGWRLYRCSGVGNRQTAPQGTPFPAVTLAPGETYMIAHERSTVTDRADALYGTSLANAGFGVWLADGQERLVDRVGVYAPPSDSACGPTSATQLRNDLDYSGGQTYQRVGTSGDASVDFVKAGRTPNSPNLSAPDPGVQPSDVLISELTNGGPAGSRDNFIEMGNFGEQSVDVSGWELYRCTRTGRRFGGTLLVTVPQGTVLEPGDVFVAAQKSVTLPDGVANARYSTSLANAGFGGVIEDADGNIMDAVGVYETDNTHEPPTDSPCTQGDALPNRLDYAFNETYQRFQSTGDNAADFVKAGRTVGELVAHDPDDFQEEPFEFGHVRISEAANAGPGGSSDNFFELANYGDEAVSLDDWTIYRCAGHTRRVGTPQLGPEELDGVTLEPGETLLAVHEGGRLHATGHYDVAYDTSLANAGFGLMVFNGADQLVDSLAVYDFPANVGRIGYSNCVMGLSATNTLDTAAGHSYQRLASTGNNVEDFVAAPRTPGELADDLHAPADIPEEDLQPVEVAPSPRPVSPSLVAPPTGATDLGEDVELHVTSHHSTGEEVEVTFRGAERIAVTEQASRAFTGTSTEAPPTRMRPPDETPVESDQIPLDGSSDPLVAESTVGFPYQRYELVVDADVDELELAWSGRSVGRNELQLYVWDHRAQAWDLIDAAGGVTGGEITLMGSVDVDSAVRGRRLDVIVQDGPGKKKPFSDEGREPNLAFKDSAEYDFSFGYMTDTQMLSEGYRDVYADMNRWLVTNEASRSIAYTFHTGDLIESWTRGTHPEPRARNEFEFASDVMKLLEDAGHPHGVTPGNHDNKWGRSDDLFNEFFPPSRYEDQPWYGGSWREDDHHNHFDVMEIGGAQFLMLYVGYFAGDEAIDWANQVLADQPDHNVIFATHEYITPDGSLSTSDNNRWTSLGDRYWEEVILPNDNVFLTLSGHVLGTALNIKRDVGGVEGRTVVEMLANYQNFERDGRRDTGFLRLLQVDTDAKTMAVNTFSPAHEEHNAWEYDPEGRYDDQDDEFTIEIDLNDIYDKRVETDVIGLQAPTGEEPIGTQVVRDGEDATVIWSGLAPDTAYGWYADAHDGAGLTARSPVWTFTTGDRTP